MNPIFLSGRIMALDLGTINIGVAISDINWTIAQPILNIKKINRDKDIITIITLAKKYKVQLIIIGITYNTDNSLGPTGIKAITLGKRLKHILGLQIIYIDEFLTSLEAKRTLIKNKVPNFRQKKIDKIAAAIILQRFLDRHHLENID